MDAGPVRINKHEPERRRQTPITLHQGCCCSCCCLHTLGSIAGAVILPHLWRASGTPAPRTPGFSALTLFWWITSFLVLGVFLCGTMADPADQRAMINTCVLLAICFPLVQIGAGFATIVVFSVWRYRAADHSYQMEQLSKAVVGVIIGAGVGIALMILGGIVASLFH